MGEKTVDGTGSFFGSAGIRATQLVLLARQGFLMTVENDV